jgi:hypothetical protein
MGGKVVLNQVQLGDSGTATQNFVWQTNADGTCKLARGNVGATTQDILTVDAAGKVTLTQNKVAFGAYQSAAQSLPSATATKVQLQTEEFDTANAFDSTTNYRFQPTVAGYYQLNAGFQVASAATVLIAFLYKNGAEHKRGAQQGGNQASSQVAALVFLNGSTDYAEFWAYQGAAAQNTVNNAALTYFNGFLAVPS